MERLTQSGHVYSDCEFMDSGMAEYMNRLATYEDIGLPDEIEELYTDEVAAAAKNIDRLMQYGEGWRLLELLASKYDIHLVELRCKVGDTVYRLITPKDSPAIILETQVKTLGEAVDLSERIGRRCALISVFASREDAERALKGGADSGRQATRTLPHPPNSRPQPF